MIAVGGDYRDVARDDQARRWRRTGGAGGVPNDGELIVDERG
jgi:hypothetical protein